MYETIESRFAKVWGVLRRADPLVVVAGSKNTDGPPEAAWAPQDY